MTTTTHTALTIKLSGAPRDKIPVQTRLHMLASWAERNDGRLLFTYAQKGPTDEADQLILASPATNLILIGTIVDAGTNYDPETWDDPNHTLPDPWASNPRKRWWRLDQVQLKTADEQVRSQLIPTGRWAGRNFDETLVEPRLSMFLVDITD